jgi:transposase
MSRPSPRRVAVGFIDAHIVGRRAGGWCMALNVRRELLDARTRLISVVRAITRSQGCRIVGGATDTFFTPLAALDLPVSVSESLVPVRSVMELLNQELAAAARRFEVRVAEDPIVKGLTTCPSVGPITATPFVAALDNVHRFAGRRGAAQVTSYLGLVPREYSSGEHQQRGRVMRSAHPYVRVLLVQAVWRICRSSDARAAALRTWAQAIARRRGKNIAVVALARPWTRILYAMWRDEIDDQPDRI